MLLRLLPAATPSQPSPPTILFTLPLPTHPYTGRSLPLPPNLLAHKTVCLHEDIECSNVLLGDKASWISGVVDDVTFSLPLNNIRVHLIDGSVITLPLREDCKNALSQVCEQVNLSFAPPAPASPRSSTSSISSVSSSTSSTSSRPSIVPSSGRRSTSALLYTLLSPLLSSNASPFALPVQAPAVKEPQFSARQHRRAARSLLVDTYRQHVLPELKASLPTAYLPWAIRSEMIQRLAEFDELREEMNSVLASTGYDTTSRSLRAAASGRNHHASSSSSSMTSASDSDRDDDAFTATPDISRSPSPKQGLTRSLSASPQSFLLSIPPAHELPASYRAVYSSQLARLTRIASRVSSIKRLDTQYEREESKRRWLDDLEKSKAGERALRRSWSNGLSNDSHYLRPIRGSPLWRSTTPADEKPILPVHPAMMEMDEEMGDLMVECGATESEFEISSDVGSESDTDTDGSCIAEDEQLVTPPPTAYERNLHSGLYPSRPHALTSPSPYQRPALAPGGMGMGMGAHDEACVPSLINSRSDESLSDTEWDMDNAHGTAKRLPSLHPEPEVVDPINFSLPPPTSSDKWSSLTPLLTLPLPLPLPLPMSPSQSSIANAKSLPLKLKQKLVNWARDGDYDDESILPVGF